MKKLLSSRLLELQKNKTQKEFAKEIGVPLTSYTNWLLGISLPKLEHIKRICEVTGTSSDWLLGISNVMRPSNIPPSMPERGLSAADPHADRYLGVGPPDHTTPIDGCPNCARAEARVDELIRTLHNLSLGRSQPDPKRASDPAKY